MFIAARFLIGFGVAVAHGAAPLLITELVHPQHRAIFTTIYNATWYFGSIVAAWVTYGWSLKSQGELLLTLLGTEGITGSAAAWAWRIPTVLQALPSVIQLIAIW
jgi:MFS family permease